ncbi:MAG TPA: helix-turn-helix domain-containing protein [Thermoanaerobaculia bacterium]|nr:helix-turn-helix domain-containing protein [Thermoanaerobaculia bacterium]
MAEQPAEGSQQAAAKLLTLTEVSKKTGISMPTLQRYKKQFQGRLPSVGRGRSQRFPESALAVFEEIKQENVGRRGRPRKGAAAAAKRTPAAKKAAAAKQAPPKKRGVAKKAAAAPAAKTRRSAAKPAARGKSLAARASAAVASGLLTLTEISKKTGISYPTLVRYVKAHARKLPSVGAGRKRRFHPEAIDVFKRLRSESPRGGRKAGAKKPAARAARAAAGGIDLTKRLAALEKAYKGVEKTLQGWEKKLAGLVGRATKTAGRVAKTATRAARSAAGLREAKTTAKRAAKRPGRPPGRPAKRAAGRRAKK